ncbi:MAG TPA: type II secretion system F family protein [Bryobacteraceae bacterium]|nr:type II secretion system F family protein [Bryobacteraceae bacterium]
MVPPILFFLASGLIITAAVWAGLQLLRPQENALADRLEELQQSATGNGTRSLRRRAGGGVLNSILYLISVFPGGDDWLRGSEKELAQAGIRNKQALAFYAIGHIVFMGVMLGGMAYLQRNNGLPQKFGGMAAAFILGYLLPAQVLHRLVRRYRRKLQDALPDTVDLLGIVLGTGLALDQALLRVAEEMQFVYPQLAGEFYTVVMQVKAGQDRSRAFQQLVRRTGIDDIKALSAMIVQSERFGTSLSHALKVYAEALRTRRRLRAETAVARAGIKMLFPIVLFILPALFVVTLVPGVLSVLRDLRGGIGAR